MGEGWGRWEGNVLASSIQTSVDTDGGTRGLLSSALQDKKNWEINKNEILEKNKVIFLPSGLLCGYIKEAARPLQGLLAPMAHWIQTTGCS